MATLLDIGQEVVKIREAVNSLEVKGEYNASLIVYAYRKCDEIVAAINEITKKTNLNNQNGSEEAEVNVQNTGSSEPD